MKIIRLSPCSDLDGGSNEMAEETLNCEKENMKTLQTENVIWWTNSEKKRLIILMKEE